jgi:hypothetical protein
MLLIDTVINIVVTYYTTDDTVTTVITTTDYTVTDYTTDCGTVNDTISLLSLLYGRDYCLIYIL